MASATTAESLTYLELPGPTEDRLAREEADTNVMASYSTIWHNTARMPDRYGENLFVGVFRRSKNDEVTAVPFNPGNVAYDEVTGIYSSRMPAARLPRRFNMGIVECIFSKNHDPGPNWSHRRKSVALVDGVKGLELTYGKMEERSTALAMGLLELGVEPGTHVLLMSPNSVEFVLVLLASLSLGAVVGIANPDLSSQELEEHVGNAKFALLLTTAEVVSSWRPSSAFSGLARTVLIGPDDHLHSEGKGDLLLSQLYSPNKPGTSPASRIHILSDDPAVVLFSSGNTGLSKGIVLTHRNLIDSATIYNENPLTQASPSDVYVCVVPQFHIYGLAAVTITQLVRGNKVVILPCYNLQGLLRAVERYHVTHLPVLPPILFDILKSGDEISKYSLSSLTQISSGGTPLQKTTIEICASRFPTVKFIQGYGLTETTAVGALFPATDYKTEYFGSVGVLASNTQARIVAIGSAPVFLPPCRQGELWLRCPGTMEGYYNDPNATNDVLDNDRWFRTGDVAYFNNDGYLFIVDPVGELIKNSGFEVSPSELEALLLTHPEIQDAVVLPYPDKTVGELPMAFVVRFPGSTLTEEDVKSYTADETASYKKVRKVAFIDNIPKLASGKILRKKLIAEAVRAGSIAAKL